MFPNKLDFFNKQQEKSINNESFNSLPKITLSQHKISTTITLKCLIYKHASLFKRFW